MTVVSGGGDPRIVADDEKKSGDPTSSDAAVDVGDGAAAAAGCGAIGHGTLFLLGNCNGTGDEESEGGEAAGPGDGLPTW